MLSYQSLPTREPVLVDSCVWIDYLNGVISSETDLLDRALANKRVLMGDLIYVEVLRGLQTRQDYTKVKEKLDKLLHVELAGHDIAQQACEHYFTLRDHGKTVRKTVDMLIGTYCILTHTQLLTQDRDFDPMAQYLGLNLLTLYTH